MKNRAIFMTVLSGLFLLLAGCAEMLTPPVDGAGPVPSGKGRLAVGVEGAAGGARTAFPTEAFDKYVLRFEYTGSEAYTHADTEWSAGLTVDLEPGPWKVHAEAYSGETLSGTGSAAVTVIGGISTPVTVRIITINTGEGIKGKLKLTAEYPPDEGAHKYEIGEGTAVLPAGYLDADKAGLAEDFYAANEAAQKAFRRQLEKREAGVIELDPGAYVARVIIRAFKGGAEYARITKMAIAHIYGGRETALTLKFSAEEFTAFTPVTGKAAYSFASGSVTVGNRAIRVYEDEACLRPVYADAARTLPLAGDLDGAGNYTLILPPGYGSLYFRQELDIAGGLTVGGKACKTGFLSGESVKIDIDDKFYRLDLAPRIRYGAAGGLTYAAKDAAVYLSLEEGYALKSGDRWINLPPGYGIASETDDDFYRFTMPGADITIMEEAINTNPVRYVTGNGSGDGDGSSWANASEDLQKMMDELAWLYANKYTGPFVAKVAAGTYRPQYKPKSDGTTDYDTDTGDRNSTFILREGVRVLGGYSAAREDIDEPTRKARFNADGTVKEAAYKAVLSGDIDGDNLLTNNAYHVVLGVGISATEGGAVLDGFTVTGGNANGTISPEVGRVPIAQTYGGGIFNHNFSLVLTNVTISGNAAANSNSGYGGGIFNTNSSPALVNVTISGNTADRSGGGICNEDSSPVLVNVTISGNSASGTEGGGGIYNDNSSPVLVNTLISGNTATNSGGGIYNNGSSSLKLVNVTIAGNYAQVKGGGVVNDNTAPGSLTIKNSIIWGNTAVGISGSTTVTYSMVQESSSTSNGNIDGTTMTSPFVEWIDPSGTGWASTTGGNYCLKTGSLAIDKGNNGEYPADADTGVFSGITLSTEAKVAINAGLETDLAGNARKNDTIDMGAYEWKR